MKNKNLLLIFARHPELGKVKTRLAKDIGTEKALEIYQFLLKRTLSVTQNLSMDKEIWYAEKIRENDLWNREFFNKKKQRGANLGERMENAFAEGFRNGYKKIVIIGSDIRDLTEKDIRTAFEKLESNNFVLGPAADGGYYLLGMNAMEANIFKNKTWGSNSVLEETLKDLEEKKTTLLETRHDVDVFEDIKDIEIFRAFL